MSKSYSRVFFFNKCPEIGDPPYQDAAGVMHNEESLGTVCCSTI